MTDVDPNSATPSKRGSLDIYPKAIGRVLFAIAVVAFALLCLSAYVIVQYRGFPNCAIAIGALWVVGVPVFFFFEHVVLFRKYGNQAQYEQFKRAQELASKVWAGGIVVLAAFLTGNFPKV